MRPGNKRMSLFLTRMACPGDNAEDIPATKKTEEIKKNSNDFSVVEEKGKEVYQCDNCNFKSEKVMSIRKHITANHVSVCKYNKFGYCKFWEGCKRIHVTEICENGASCTKIRSCHKRHPKVCKLYELENSCRFGSACSYLHLSSNKLSETNQRLQYLENCLKDMTSKIESLEGELEKVKANHISEGKRVKEIPSKEKEIRNIFKCDICEYETENQVTLKKHKNTKHSMFKCKECGQNSESKNASEEHLKKDHVQSKPTFTKSDEDKICPICGKGFMAKEIMLEHFKVHMNPIDPQQRQTLSALITNEAKEIIVDSKNEEMTLDDYDKLLDKYEALYPPTDDEESSDS